MRCFNLAKVRLASEPVTTTIRSGEIKGVVAAPASKSMMIRALVAGMLADGTSLLRNPSFCDDAISTIEIARGLGADIQTKENIVSITGGFKPVKKVLNCGESGLAIRMFSSIVSLHNEEITLTGTGTLRERPLGMVVAPLRSLGVQITTERDLLPVRVKGPLKGGFAKVDGSMSSQFLTGLLMSLPLVDGDSELEVTDLQSKPYIDLTLQVINDFGVVVDHKHYKKFVIKGGQKYMPGEYTVEGDWSGAAFLLVAGAIGGGVEVREINLNSEQADKKILNALEMAGAKIEYRKKSIIISRDKLYAFEMDITDCPDLAPPLVALAAHCKGTTRLKGSKRLLIKESNRSRALQDVFLKLGIKVETRDNDMLITGGTVRKGKVSSYGDHRIVMAAAIAAIGGDSQVIIRDTGCISKSYPGFFNDLKKIGGFING
jgi:3-phosphoshikimate 1-carboxyvinyltransferase